MLGFMPNSRRGFMPGFMRGFKPGKVVRLSEPDAWHKLDEAWNELRVGLGPTHCCFKPLRFGENVESQGEIVELVDEPIVYQSDCVSPH